MSTKYILRSDSPAGAAGMENFKEILGEYFRENGGITLNENIVSMLFRKHMRCDYHIEYYVFETEKDYNWYILKFG